MKKTPRKKPAAKPKATSNGKAAALAELGADIQALNGKIAELNSAPAELPQETKDLINVIRTAGATVASKLEALRT